MKGHTTTMDIRQKEPSPFAWRDQKVSNRLPRRPRLRIEGLKHVTGPFDLIPVFPVPRNEHGRIDLRTTRWILPQQYDVQTNSYVTRYATFDQLKRRLEPMGARVRVLEL